MMRQLEVRCNGVQHVGLSPLRTAFAAAAVSQDTDRLVLVVECDRGVCQGRARVLGGFAAGEQVMGDDPGTWREA